MNRFAILIVFIFNLELYGVQRAWSLLECKCSTIDLSKCHLTLFNLRQTRFLALQHQSGFRFKLEEVIFHLYILYSIYKCIRESRGVDPLVVNISI